MSYRSSAALKRYRPSWKRHVLFVLRGDAAQGRRAAGRRGAGQRQPRARAGFVKRAPFAKRLPWDTG